jgi:YbgC/YbaW family acyl-CoA thioester hydrolase
METAWDWGATFGLSIAESKELGLGWAIRESEINFLRPLYPNDEFELTIWLVDWRRIRGTRCFELILKDSGELIAQGVQEFVSLDLKTMRPAATPDHIMDKIKMENPRVIPHQKFPKFQIQREYTAVIQRIIEWRDLDSQEHVNNANYAAFAEDAATQVLATLGWSPSQFKAQDLDVANQRVHIQYLSPASWGEILNVKTSLVELKPSGGVWFIEMERTSDHELIAQSTIEWSLTNRVDGEKQILPESLFSALKDKVVDTENNAS